MEPGRNRKKLQEKSKEDKVNSEQLKQNINKLNQERKMNGGIIKSFRNLQTTKIGTIPDKEQEMNNLHRNLGKEKEITTIMTKNRTEMNEAMIKRFENLNKEMQASKKEMEKQSQSADKKKEINRKKLRHENIEIS